MRRMRSFTTPSRSYCGKCRCKMEELVIDGRLPVNASGGVVSTNSIGAPALNRVTDCALQIMGKAEGGHQVSKRVRMPWPTGGEG